jgi:hypothetical protein
MILWALLLTAQLQVPDGTSVVIPDWEAGPEFEEIQLGEGAELILPKPEDFRAMRIKSLIAKEGAKIRFLQNVSGHDTESSVDGGDGSQAILLIDRLDGHVIVESRGADGGQGRDGRDGRQGLEGRRGRSGFKLIFFFITGGERGHAGEDGEAGEDGGDGGRGGNGGDVQVYYRSKTPDSQILIDVSSGRGGMGGKAGRGGIGGVGGPGGRGIVSGPQGPMGIQGANGRPGRPGEPGFPGKATVVQVDRGLYLCLMEAHLLGQSEGELESCLRN